MGKLHSGIPPYFQGILQAVYLVMHRTGLSKGDMATISRVAMSMATDQLDTKAVDNPRVSMVVASALHTWHHRRSYLGGRGRPRALPLQNGPRSVATLIRREDNKIDVPEVLAAMKRLKLLKPTKGGLYLPAGRFATIARQDPVLAEHVCNSLGRLLTTVNYNVGESTGDTRLIERSAQVHDLPRQKLDEFRDFANAQGEAFLSIINDWIESRRKCSDQDNRVRKARAGVHVFAFSERVPSQAK